MRLRSSATRALLAAAAIIAAASSARAGAQEVLLTPEQALKEIFPEVARTTVEERVLSSPTRAALEKQLGRRIENSFSVTRIFDGRNAFRGYAVVTEEIGKYKPITFMVGITPEMKVKDVAVLVYREGRGGDVKRRRFLSQYRGKGLRDPIDLNRDIINISGATMSVRSLNAGVKKVLAEVAAAYAPEK